MDKEQISISKFENREPGLEIVDGTPTFSSSNDLLAAESLFLRQVGLKPTDSDEAKSKTIFGRNTEVLYQNKDGKDLYYIAYKNRTILAFEGEEGTNQAQELIEKFFSDVAERELGELHEAITLKNNKDEAVMLEIQQFKQELTNLEKGEVKAYVHDTKVLFRKLLNSQLKHTNIFRTLGVRETEKERLAYQKLKLVTKNAIQTLNRLEVKTDSAMNEARALNSVHKETEWMRNVLLEKLDRASNDVDSFYRFSAQIPNEVLTSRVLFTVDDYKKWFGMSLKQDYYDAFNYGQELGYNIETQGRKRKNGYNELESQLEAMNLDPAQLAILGYQKVTNADGTVSIVATTSNFDKKTCRRCNTKAMTGDFTKDFLNGGLVRAVPEQLVKFAEETMGHDLTKGQKNFLRLAGLIGGGYLVFKALQKGREGLGKIGGDSFMGKIAALVAIEAGMTVFAGQGAIQSILGLAFGGKGAEKIFGWGQSLGLTDALQLDQNTAIPIAGTTALFGGTKCADMQKYVSNKNGKLEWDYTALMRDFPENSGDINNLKNYETTNPNYVEDYFRTIGVDPLNPKKPNKTLAEQAVENKSEHAATLLAILKAKNLEPKNPDTRTLMVSQYDPSLSDWENIQKFQEKGWIKEIEVAYGVEKEKLDDVKRMLKNIQFKDIKGFLGDMKSRDSIDIDGLEAFAKQKNSKEVAEVIAKYGSPEMGTLIFEVFNAVGIQEGTPSPLTGTQYDELMVEAVIGLFELRKQKENQLKTFLAGEGLTIKDAHVQDVNNAFTLNQTISTPQERSDALKKMVLEHPEYFEFNYREVPYIKNVDQIDPSFIAQLENAPGLTMKEKTILAAVGTQLKKDYPGFPISYSSAGDGKIAMSFTGAKNGFRKDRDGNSIGENKFDMTLNIKDLNIDGFVNKDLRVISFQNSMPDKGLVGLPLHVFQMGLMREIYEGQSTTTQPFDKARGGRAEMFGRKEGLSFSKASFMQQMKQRGLDLEWTDLIPGYDPVAALLEYGTESLRSQNANGKVSNLPTNSEYQNALIDNLNNRKHPNGDSIWQFERERKEDEIADNTLKRIYTDGIFAMGLDAASPIAKDIKEYIVAQAANAPEWVKQDAQKFMNMMKKAHDNGIELTKTIVYGMGNLLKMGVEFTLKGTELVFELAGTVITVGSELGNAIMQDIETKIQNGETWQAVGTLAGVIALGGATYMLVNGLIAKGLVTTVTNGAGKLTSLVFSKQGMVTIGLTGLVGGVLYLTGVFSDSSVEINKADNLDVQIAPDVGPDNYNALNKDKKIENMLNALKALEKEGKKMKYSWNKGTKKLTITLDKGDGSAPVSKVSTIDFNGELNYFELDPTTKEVSGKEGIKLPEKVLTAEEKEAEKKKMQEELKKIDSGSPFIINGNVNDIRDFSKDLDGDGKSENVLKALRDDLKVLVEKDAIKNLMIDTANKKISYTFTQLASGPQNCTIYLKAEDGSKQPNQGYRIDPTGKEKPEIIAYHFK